MNALFNNALFYSHSKKIILFIKAGMI